MADSQRHLIIWLAAFACLLAAPEMRGQPAPKEPPVLFRTLAPGQNDIFDVFYDDQNGRPVAVTATSSGFTPPYVCPPDGLVSLYRLIPAVPPETKPRRLPIAETRLGKGGPWLLLMMVSGPLNQAQRVTLQAVDDSWIVHPVHTMRVFNFSSRRAAVKLEIGADAFELAPGGSRMVPYPLDASQVWVKAAMMEATGWVLRVGGPQATIPQTRATLILSDAPPERDNPDYHGVLIRNLVDAAPPPPPTQPLAQTGRR